MAEPDPRRVEVELHLNGRHRSAWVDPRSLLVETLRDDFGAHGPKVGCLTGDCGACTVRVDGALTKSCLRLAVAESGRTVETLEGMGEVADDGSTRLSRLQQAFWDHHAFQCGFCLSGMLFAGEDLLQHNPSPSTAEIRQSLVGNLCRCTGYDAIVRAIASCAEPATSAQDVEAGDEPVA